MKHRGPEASNVRISENKKVGFGHVRLAIVDIDERSNQPFSIDNGEYTIIFNGEIYNYEILRNMLIKEHHITFKTRSDTEVLLYMYKHLGKECLKYLEGIFAFSIFDKKEDQLFIARDFAGQKPFVYINDNSGFYFASEIPAILELYPEYKKTIDYSVLKIYLIENLNHIPDQICIFKGIKKLENASYMIIRNGQIIEKKRYALLEKKILPKTQNEVSFLYEKLELMKPKDIDYAAFLSGGIDSSFICSGLKKNRENQTDSYTLKISKKDEDFERSKYVARKLNLNHYIIDLENTDFLKSIDESIYLLGEPYFHITSVFADEILKKVKEKHKVIFTGGGGDECYYGYNNLLFIIMDIYFSIKKYIPLFLINLLNRVTKYKYSLILKSTKDSFKENFFSENLKKNSYLFKTHKSNEESYEKIKNIISDFKEFVKYESYIDFSYMFGLFIENMHSLVIQGDLIGMKNSIEIRSLFLERSVIERAYSIPLRKKIKILNLKEGKEILRKQLIKTFGNKFIYSKKIGFGVEHDFKGVFEGKYIKDINIKIEHLLRRGIFEENEINILFKNFRKNFHLIMKLYALETRFEHFID